MQVVALPIDRERRMLGRYLNLREGLTLANLIATSLGRVSADAFSPQKRPPQYRPQPSWWGAPPQTQAAPKAAPRPAPAPAPTKGVKGAVTAFVAAVKSIFEAGDDESGFSSYRPTLSTGFANKKIKPGLN